MAQHGLGQRESKTANRRSQCLKAALSFVCILLNLKSNNLTHRFVQALPNHIRQLLIIVTSFPYRILELVKTFELCVSFDLHSDGG